MKKSLINLIGVFGVVLTFSSCSLFFQPSRYVHRSNGNNQNNLNGGSGNTNSANEIAVISIGENVVIVDGTNIVVTVPSGTDVTTLRPNITIPDGATVSPESGAVQNFTNPIVYTVTARDGSKKRICS